MKSLIPYREVERKKVRLGKRNMKGEYNDQKALKQAKIVPEKYPV
jgi:hypothetical protein